MSRVALVIGGTSGIGLATALALRSSGLWVFVASSNRDKVEAAVAALNAVQADTPPCGGCVIDVATPASVDIAFKGIAAATGGVLHVLVCAAGIIARSAPEVEPLVAWDRVLSVNLTGAFIACQRAFPLLRAAEGDRSIVLIASIGAHQALSHATSYSVSKAGIVALARQLAIDWAAEGIRVNALSPGFVLTDINRDALTGTARGAAVLTRTPQGRFGTVDEVAAAAAFLASPAGSFVTGSTLVADGGFTAAGLAFMPKPAHHEAPVVAESTAAHQVAPAAALAMMPPAGGSPQEAAAPAPASTTSEVPASAVAVELAAAAAPPTDAHVSVQA